MKGEMAVDVAVSPSSAGPVAPPLASPARLGSQHPQHGNLAIWAVWSSLSAAARALCLLGCAQALTAAVFAITQFAEDGWEWGLLQDTLLILCSAALTLVLLVDAFVRENAYQLLAALALNCALGLSQLAVFVATARGHNTGAAAAGAVCLVLQLGATALARPAYRGFGWRMYSHIASHWRLRPAEQQRLRLCQLSRQRFSAVAKTDALLLAAFLVVTAVNAANPSAGTGPDSHTQPVWLLVAAAAVAAPVLAGWLAACWVVAARGPQRRGWLATAVDLTYPLCYVPPLLVIFAGASKAGQLAQPHAPAYLILYSTLCLAARTAIWWAARQLSSAQLAGTAHTAGGDMAGNEAGMLQHSDSFYGAEQAQQALPDELLPLLRGAWLLKLPSVTNGGPAGASSSGLGAAPALTGAGSGSLSMQPSGSCVLCSSTTACFECTGGCGAAAAAPGCSPCLAARQRFFQLSADGACLRWNWDRWVLVPHVQGISCCDECHTISLALLLEPDLVLRFPSPGMYSEWASGLRILLALLLQPDDLLAQQHSGPSHLASSGGSCSGLPCSDSFASNHRRRSSLRKEVVLNLWPPPAPAPLTNGGGHEAGAFGPTAAATAVEVVVTVAAGTAAAGTAAAGTAAATGSGSPREVGFGRKLTCNTGRVCDRSDSEHQLALAAARSQAALTAAGAQQPQQQPPQQQLQRERRPSTDGGKQALPLRRSSTIELVASTVSLQELQPAFSTGELPAGARHQQQLPALCTRRWQRLRSGVQRALSLPGSLWRASTDAAAAVASAVPGVTPAANASPSRQPLTAGALNPSSSCGDLPEMQAAGSRHVRALTLGVWAEQAQPAEQCLQQQQQQEQQRQYQHEQQQQQQEQHQHQFHHHQQYNHQQHVPPLDLGQHWQHQHQLQFPNHQHQHQQVPPLNLGQLAPEQHRLRPEAMPACGNSSSREGATAATQLSPAAAATGASASAAANQRPAGPLSGRSLMPGPFIHLHWAIASAEQAPHGDHAQQAQHAQHSTRPADRQDSLATLGPSFAGSEASTPAHPSAQSSPLRGSPNRQQQLQTFQRYLQQQLHAQQQGRFGPGLADGSGSSGGAGSGSFSGAASPPQTSRKETDASPLAYYGGGQEGTGNTPAGPPPAAADAGMPPLPPVVGGASAGAGPGSQRIGGGGASRLSQQQFAARIQGLVRQQQPPQQQQQQEVDGTAWGSASVSQDGGSAPPSGLQGWTPGSGALLTRAESAFSSWGLPTPTTATSRTPFNGLSRFNSLAPSLAHTPLATFRQHPAFATAHNQGPSQQAHPALLAGQAGWGAPTAGTAGGSGGAAANGQQQRGRAHAAGAAAGGGGDEEREEREGEASISPCASTGASPTDALSTMGFVGGLGISVPVEMVPFSDLVFGKLLGQGSEGAVYAAWFRETPVAVKRTRSLMELEINLHTGSHDNLVQLRGLCSHGPDLYLVMELCPRGTLDVLIHKGHLQHQPGATTGGTAGAAGGAGLGHRLDPLKLLPIVRSVARGMLHLHTRKPAVFHRDLKPGNLFLGHGGVVKVGDFGMSRYAESWRREVGDGMLERTLTPGVIGTAAYSAPELLNPDTPTADSSERQPSQEDEERILKADVYAFGVTLWELLERKRPFGGMDGFQIQTQWYLEPNSMRLPRPIVPDSTPPAARLILDTLAGLVESCTRWDPDARPTFQEILATIRTCTVPGAAAAAAAAGVAGGATNGSACGEAPAPPTLGMAI